MSEIGSGNGSSYPAALDTDATPEVNSPNVGKTKARAEVPNDQSACIVALETELGTDPAGSLTDVKTYLQTEHTTDGTHGAVTADSIEMQSGQLQLSIGNDVASANALPILTDGNIFDVTGTTNITSIASVGVGTVIKLHFDGVVLISHSATDLVLPDGLDITTSAGDEFEFYEYASGDWRLTTSSRQQANLAGNMVQRVNTQSVAYETIAVSTAITDDDDIPQTTEGAIVTSLNTAITPTNTSNELYFDISLQLYCVNAGTLVACIMQDAAAGALAVTQQEVNATSINRLNFTYKMAAGTISATTFKIYISRLANTDSIYINGDSVGRRSGGVISSSTTITEVKV